MEGYVLKDSLGVVIGRGSLVHLHGLRRVLLADPWDVTEDDEVEFGKELFQAEFTGNLTIDNDLEVGEYVHYMKKDFEPQKGRVKSKSVNFYDVFIVYDCIDDWDNYEDYTGCLTDIKDLERIVEQ